MKMNIEFVKKWIVALRSGKYQQGAGSLRYDDNFCCLGVACDVYDPERWTERESYTGDNHLSENYSFPPDDILNQLKNPGICDVKIGAHSYCLTHLNDTRKFTFNEIADAIEADWINNKPLSSHPKLP